MAMRAWPVLLFLTLSLAGCASEAPEPEPQMPDDPSEEAPSLAMVPEWGPLESAFIRPGSSLGGYCTFNFLFYGLNGSAYIGTAGHCTDDIGERVSSAGEEIGTVVYDSDLIGHGSDFSLILLDAERVEQAHPQMRGFNGPTGIIGTDELSEGDIINVYGYGAAVGQSDVTRPRSGVLVAWNDWEYDIDIPAVNGDSGASLLHQSGQAFGIISRYGIDGEVPSTDTGPLMSFVFDGMAQAGYGDVQLATI